MTDLNRRVSNVLKNAKKLGKDQILVLCDCIESMGENWTPLATLIAGSNPKDEKVMRLIVGKATENWSIKKDTGHKTGLRFAKTEGSAINSEVLNNLRALAEQGHVLQGVKVAEYLGKADREVKELSSDDLVKMLVKSISKKVSDHAISQVEALIAARMLVKELEAIAVEPVAEAA